MRKVGESGLGRVENPPRVAVGFRETLERTGA